MTNTVVDSGTTLAWIANGQIVLGKKIVFEINKPVIRPESFPVLDDVAIVLRDNAWMKVRVEGHGDSDERGRATSLTQNRARAVRQYLVQKGIDAQRIEARGFADQQPLVPNDTPEGREKNRRIEIVVIE